VTSYRYKDGCLLGCFCAFSNLTDVSEVLTASIILVMTTQRNIPYGSHLHTRRSEILKSHKGRHPPLQNLFLNGILRSGAVALNLFASTSTTTVVLFAREHSLKCLLDVPNIKQFINMLKSTIRYQKSDVVLAHTWLITLGLVETEIT